MGLKKAENQVKILLAETILAMCRNTLNNHAEVSVEGLLGITLDDDEIFLVSINETIKNPNVPSKSKPEESDKDSSVNRKRSKEAEGESNSESEEDSDKDSKSKKRRRKRKKRRSSKSSGDDSGESSSESDTSELAQPLPTQEMPMTMSRPIAAQPNNRIPPTNEQSLDDDSRSNSQTVHVKTEVDDDDEDDGDLVFVKEEMADVPTTSDSSFMQHQYAANNLSFSQQDFPSFSAAQHSMSSDLSQPQPGPSTADSEGMISSGTQNRGTQTEEDLNSSIPEVHPEGPSGIVQDIATQTEENLTSSVPRVQPGSLGGGRRSVPPPGCMPHQLFQAPPFQADFVCTTDTVYKGSEIRSGSRCGPDCNDVCY